MGVRTLPSCGSSRATMLRDATALRTMLAHPCAHHLLVEHEMLFELQAVCSACRYDEVIDAKREAIDPRRELGATAPGLVPAARRPMPLALAWLASDERAVACTRWPRLAAGSRTFRSWSTCLLRVGPSWLC